MSRSGEGDGRVWGRKRMNVHVVSKVNLTVGREIGVVNLSVNRKLVDLKIARVWLLCGSRVNDC